MPEKNYNFTPADLKNFADLSLSANLPSAIKGKIDVAEIVEDSLLLEGWLLSHENGKITLPETLYLVIDGQVAGTCKSNLERKDVAKFIGDGCPLVCGFETRIPLSELKTFPRASSAGLMLDGRIFLLPERQTKTKNLSLPQANLNPVKEKLVYLFGTRTFFQVIPVGDRRLDGHEILVQTAGNTGNLVFQTAIMKQIGIPNIEFIRARAGNCKVGVFCMANYVREDIREPDPLFIDIFSKNPNLPLCFIGLGAQAPHSGYKLRLQPKFADFFREISARSVSIGVRDAYTAEVLNDIGVKNALVIGCPAMFYNQAYRPLIKKKKDTNSLKIAYGITADNIERAAGAINRVIMRDAIKNSRPVILQTLRCFMDLALNNATAGDLQECRQFLAFAGLRTDQATLDKLAAILKVFINPADWIWFMKTRDFYIGSRIHGVITSLLAGTPALLLAHDSRTAGLAQTLHIPFMEIAQFDVAKIREYYEKADYESFNATYPRLYNNYIDFLNANNITHICEKI